ncbi:MAG: hypothetical protein Tsb0010_13430 [Parvularculaceae bacterium]
MLIMQAMIAGALAGAASSVIFGAIVAARLVEAARAAGADLTGELAQRLGAAEAEIGELKRALAADRAAADARAGNRD